MLDALAERAGVQVFLRGNELTLDGEQDALDQARALVDGLSELVDEGISVGPQTVDAVAGVLDANGQAADVLHDVVWRHRGTAGDAEDAGPETLRRRDPPEHRHVRHRAGRHRQDVPRNRPGRRRAVRAGGGTDHPHPPGGRGRRAARASCPATCRPRSTRTCGRCSTRCTTCSTPTGWRPHMEKGMIEVAPLAFMRGRTLNDSFIILDEAQNTSPEQMQMFLTRLGFGSKVVVTGDITQIDLPRGPALGPGQRHAGAAGRARHRVHQLRPRRRRSPQAGAADRQRLPAAHRGDGRGAARVTLAIELDNRSSAALDEAERGGYWRLRWPRRGSTMGRSASRLSTSRRWPS